MLDEMLVVRYPLASRACCVKQVLFLPPSVCLCVCLSAQKLEKTTD